MFLFIAGLITGIVAGLVVVVILNAVMINYVRRLRMQKQCRCCGEPVDNVDGAVMFHAGCYYEE
jgi:sorbitol-specific phosphotransferase system component IIC